MVTVGNAPAAPGRALASLAGISAPLSRRAHIPTSRTNPKTYTMIARIAPRRISAIALGARRYTTSIREGSTAQSKEFRYVVCAYNASGSHLLTLVMVHCLWICVARRRRLMKVCYLLCNIWKSTNRNGGQTHMFASTKLKNSRR